jgi:hypothetical protein
MPQVPVADTQANPLAGAVNDMARTFVTPAPATTLSALALLKSAVLSGSLGSVFVSLAEHAARASKSAALKQALQTTIVRFK